MRNFFISFLAALPLSACAAMDPEPAMDATAADRVVFSHGSRFRALCADEIGVRPGPNFTFDEAHEKCGCFDDYMVQNLDGKLVAWASNQRNWWDVRMPPWAVERANGPNGMRQTMLRAVAACKIEKKS